MEPNTTTELERAEADFLASMMERFAVALTVTYQTPEAQRERALLDAGQGLTDDLRKLGFGESLIELYRATFLDALRGFLKELVAHGRATPFH